MLQKPSGRGGRTQHYYVSPVRYSLSAGGDDAERQGARLAGFLLVAAGVMLIALIVLPLLGQVGRIFMTLFAPFWGVLGLVAAIPTGAEPWVLPTYAVMFLAIGIGILRGSRIAHLVGMGLAVLVFAPALWAGPLVAGFLIVALWRGQKALPA